MRVSVARRDNGTSRLLPVFRQGNVHDALSEMDLLPAKSEQFTAAHRGLYSEDDKLPQQWRSSPITRGEQGALLLHLRDGACGPVGRPGVEPSLQDCVATRAPTPGVLSRWRG